MRAPAQNPALHLGEVVQAQGQPIYMELGGATLEQVQALVFRTTPGAEFVGMESPAPAATPTAPEATVPPTELSPAPAAQPVAAAKPALTPEQQRIADGTKRIGDAFVPPVIPIQISGTSISSFVSSMTPMAQRRAMNALATAILSNGKPVSRSSLVERLVDAGRTVVLSQKGKRRLQSPEGLFLAESQISKTAMDYADYLVKQKSTRPQTVAPSAPPPTSKTLPGEVATSEEKYSPSGAEVKPAVVRPASGLVAFAKARLPQSVADKITSEAQAESFRAQWVKEGSPQEQPQPAAQAAPVMQGGMDNLRFTSDPVKTTKQGGADAKDAKAKLIAELEKAVKQAPAMNEGQTIALKELRQVMNARPVDRKVTIDDAAMELEKWGLRKVTIEIPGDGTFTVWNTKENLTELLRRARRLQTSTQPPKGYTESGISKADREWVQEQLRNPQAAQPVAKAMESEAKSQEQPQPAAQAAPVMQSGLQDFGVKLGGARKDLAASIARDLTDADIAGMSLSEIWPKSEVDAIEDKDMAALAHAVRSIIPSKPRQSHKLARWVERVKLAKSLMGIAQERGIPAVMLKMSEYRLQTFADKITLLRGVDRVHWERLGEVQNYPDAYAYGPDGKTHILAPTAMVVVDGKRRIKSDTLENLIARVNETLSAEGKPDVKMQFQVRGRRDGVGGFFINKVGDPLRRKLKVFETADEAIKFKRDAANYEVLAQAWEDIKATDNVKETDVRRAENRPRTGADHRRGQDATPEMFMGTFGFRGVEFGNWVSQGASQAERQGMLNAAYDALMDLANVVGIPPNAISLNGTLGLGLGSRGHGWGSAHYEPDTIVINLTKTRGAGSLAHEWFHALDNYFQRHRNVRGVKDGSGDYITQQSETYYEDGEGHRLSEKRFKEWAGSSINQDTLADWKRVEGVRPEVAEAFAELVKVLNASPMAKRAALVDKGKSDGYWSRIIERAARSFENYIIAEMQLRGFQNDYLANVVSVEDFARDKGRYPYLLPEEVAPVAKAFNDLFGTVRVVPEGGVELDAVDAKLTEWIKKLDLKPGALYEGVTGAPVWVTKASARGVLQVVRVAYRASKDLAAALRVGIAWLRAQNLRGFSESEAAGWLNATLTLDADSVTETAADTLLDEPSTPDQQATAQRMADAADGVVTTAMGVPVVIHKQELSAVAPEGVPSANPTGNTTLIPPGPPVNPLGTQLSINPDHPHACGENNLSGWNRTGYFGPSPRVWGELISSRFTH